MRIFATLGLLAAACNSHALSITLDDLPMGVRADVIATYGSTPLEAQLIGNKTWALHYNSNTLGDAWLIHYSLAPTSFYSYGGGGKPPLYEPAPPTTTYFSGDAWVALQSQYNYSGNPGYSVGPDYWGTDPNAGSALFFADIHGMAGNCNPCQLGLFDGILNYPAASAWNTGPGSSMFFYGQYGIRSTIPSASMYDALVFNQINFLYTQLDEMGRLSFNPNDTRTQLFLYQYSGGGYHYDERSELYVEPVPLPAAFWLFGSGAACLYWQRRRIINA